LSVFLGMIFFAHALRVPRSPAATTAWLLVVLLVPVIGLLLFLLFGSRKDRNPQEWSGPEKVDGLLLSQAAKASVIERS